jgi:hypothetical protein
MDMGEQTTAAGIVIASDDGKAHGVKPRWAEVYKVGEQTAKLMLNRDSGFLLNTVAGLARLKLMTAKAKKNFKKLKLNLL